MMNNSSISITPGIADSDFIRGEVPMTKQEVRVISISKLELTPGDIILDIGAGTGSISIEIARLLPESTIFAVEHNDDAIDLIKQNIEKFNVQNVKIIEGSAPEILKQIPKVNRIFIGGSSGNLGEILIWVQNNSFSGTRIVINAITINTLVAAHEYLSGPAFHNTDIIQVSVNRIEKVGNADMFRPQSPVFIISSTLV